MQNCLSPKEECASSGFKDKSVLFKGISTAAMHLLALQRHAVVLINPYAYRRKYHIIESLYVGCEHDFGLEQKLLQSIRQTQNHSTIKKKLKKKPLRKTRS